MNTNQALSHLITILGDRVIFGSEYELRTTTDHYKDESGEWRKRPELHIVVWANDILFRGDHTPEEHKVRLASYRFFKHLTGPWISESDPPNVHLKGRRILTNPLSPSTDKTYLLSVTIYGTHECRIVNEREVPISPEDQSANARRAAQLEAEANALRTQVSRVEKEWRCVATIPEVS
jgi:hypothetical protein